ncbi:hypothetical protein WJ60_32715 [Burkholderia ubonensis]|uniref:hypothetical protein n=1 Tax=Burkholderia ubonensis TaxID=101571 RepID=UPI00075C0AFB|nr:hypothetical protein [Burkholderia ubonensis]KVM75107.1 hypothetical protein WJ60_32715 [Burkholderia ubonensis]
MSDVQTEDAPLTANQRAALEDAVEQIGTAIASNAFPLFYVAQNVYDTVESIWTVWAVRESQDEMARLEAGFDLVFAVVGWVPMVGAGVKRTFRLVNHKSEIYGPVLYDILRYVLQKLNIPTSPAELIDKLFEASHVKATLDGAREQIKKSWIYRHMSTGMQTTFDEAMLWVESNLPYWTAQFLERKLLHWRRKQANSAAHAMPEKAKQTEKPGKVGEEAKEGHNRAVSTPKQGTVNAKLAVSKVINTKYTGLIAEHIGAYYCLEEMKWGSGWHEHDVGTAGRWEKQPSETVLGRLDSDGKLEQLLTDNEKGHGIDAVWRATPINNNMRPYAIVEIKGSLVDKELKTPGRQKEVWSKLGTIKGAATDVAADAAKVAAGEAELVPPPPSGDLLLEPELDDQTPNQAGSASGKGGGSGNARNKSSGGSGTGSTNKRQRRTQKKVETPDTSGKPKSEEAGNQTDIVQMSGKWITINLPAAVGPKLELAITNAGYARHLLYIPFFLKSAKKHATVWYSDGNHHEHTKHDLPALYHYHDADVARAVKKKAARIAKRNKT